MRTKIPLSLETVFQEDSLQKLQQNVKQITILTQVVNEVIPARARKYCQAISYRSSCLTLECANATWRYFLQQQQNQLISQLQQRHLPDINCIEIKINPCLLTPNIKLQEKQPNNRKISAQVATQLEELAQNCDGLLKESLLRLAQLKDCN